MGQPKLRVSPQRALSKVWRWLEDGIRLIMNNAFIVPCVLYLNTGARYLLITKSLTNYARLPAMILSLAVVQSMQSLKRRQWSSTSVATIG